MLLLAFSVPSGALWQFVTKKLLKGVPELLGHAAVDTKVERVRQGYDHVEHQDDAANDVIVEEFQLHARCQHMQDVNDT